MEISFTNPQFLWFFLALPTLILLHFISIRYTRAQALKFANFPAIEKITGQKLISKNYLLLILRLVTFSIIILAISGPVLWYTGRSSNFDFVMAIDASGSMASNDYDPNRLEAAKLAAKIFVDNAPKDSEIGIMSFSGITFLKQFPSNNFERVKASIDDIKVEYVGGTAIGSVIIDASTVLTTGNKARRILLLTDGQNNVGPDVKDAIDYANDKHIIIDTVGIATKEGGSMPGLTSVTILDEDSLKNISAATGGSYIRVQNETDLGEAFQRLAISSEQKLSEDLTVPSLLAAFVLLFLEWGLLNTKFRTLP
ncbi:MAG: VWA domain-containing protein [Candidatus Aenigmarchaeota archaeon]|nr:VWA domain-containing protein [Candidatus Aenigmarchaeota archaeon]